MGKPALHYTLQVSLEDDTGRITITSDEVPGLLIWAPPQEAFADVHKSVKKLRLLNARAEMETSPVQAVCDRAAHLADVPTPLVPKGHFWRGIPESNRHQCRNCGEHYDRHLHTDEASTCPTANRGEDQS